MTREVAHFQQFQAALETIQPNFPPGIFQTNPKFSNVYYNTSQGEDARGPWNEGTSTKLQEEWQYIDDPIGYVRETDGLLRVEPQGTERTEESVRNADEKLAKERSNEILSATPKKDIQWDGQPTSKKNRKK